MRALRKICNEHGILLIADEVQTGFARTGKLFAMQHYDVLADLITMAKSLAGGMPLSGVVGRADVMDAAAPGGLGGTYAGNPLAVASAHAVLEIIDEEKLCERATQLGDVLKAKLNALQADVPQIADVRPGAMIAVEFLKPGFGRAGCGIHEARADACARARPAAARVRRTLERRALPVPADDPASRVRRSARDPRGSAEGNGRRAGLSVRRLHQLNAPPPSS